MKKNIYEKTYSIGDAAESPVSVNACSGLGKESIFRSQSGLFVVIELSVGITRPRLT